MYELHEMAKDTIDFHGGFKQFERLPQSYIEQWRGRIPDSFLTLWETVGLGSLADGSLQFCRPEDYSDILALLFGADEDFHAKDCHVLAYSAFGELFVWSEKLWPIRIDLVYLTISCRLLTNPHPLKFEERAVWSMIVSSCKDRLFDTYDVKDKELYRRAVKKLGALQQGEVFGFFPALAMGGTATLDNLQRVSASEHFSFLAQLDQPVLQSFSATSFFPTKIRKVG